MSDKKVNAFITRDFKDAGTETSFTKGGVDEIADGAFVNYEAAGLARKATADEIRAAKGDAPATDAKGGKAAVAPTA